MHKLLKISYESVLMQSRNRPQARMLDSLMKLTCPRNPNDAASGIAIVKRWFSTLAVGKLWAKNNPHNPRSKRINRILI